MAFTRFSFNQLLYLLLRQQEVGVYGAGMPQTEQEVAETTKNYSNQIHAQKTSITPGNIKQKYLIVGNDQELEEEEVHTFTSTTAPSKVEIIWAKVAQQRHRKIYLVKMLATKHKKKRKNNTIVMNMLHHYYCHPVSHILSFFL